MKRFLAAAGSVAALAAAAIAILFFGIVSFPRGVFSHTYQSVIQDKVRYYEQTKGRRLILVGGSSAAYGIDEERLEQETGCKVANLGLYGGLGDLFQTQLVRANLQAGDLVVLAYEYNWIDEESFTTIPADMVMSGIDDDLPLYRFVPLRQWPSVLGYLFPYAAKKAEYAKTPGEDIHHTLFDENGRLTQDRPESLLLDYAENPKAHNPVDLAGRHVSRESAAYLSAFRTYAERRGARVVMAAPPLLADAVSCDPEEFDRIVSETEDLTGIEWISRPQDYFYPAEYMYDTVYHCNSEGARIRTDMLYADLDSHGLTADWR